MESLAARTLALKLAERIRSRDRDGALRIALDSVRDAGGPDAAADIADLYTQVLGPLMWEVGDGWQAGTTRVWEEHYATQIVRDIVDSLAGPVAQAAAVVPPTGRRVLLACPPGEQHDLGLRMLADRFRLTGWDVYYLGTDTPVDEIAAAARTLGIELLVLSASTHFNRVLLRDVAARLRTALPGVKLGVGGPAFTLDREWPADELLDPAALGLPGSPPSTAAPPPATSAQQPEPE